MIVRILGEGQYELPDGDAERLNDLDNQAVAEVEAGNESGFRDLWNQMLALVESDGTRLDDEELVESEVIMPPRDVSFAEAQAEFTGDGLIPDGASSPAGDVPRGSTRLAGTRTRQPRSSAPAAPGARTRPAPNRLGQAP